MSLGACRSSVAVPGSGDDTMRDTRAADAVERTERALDEFHAATARAGIAARLLPHQREGVLWMLRRERGARDSAHPAVRHLIRAAARARSAAIEMEAGAGRPREKRPRESRNGRDKGGKHREPAFKSDMGEHEGAPRPGDPSERLLGSAFEGGVLGDDMGMGKTLQMLSLIAIDACWCGLLEGAASEECDALIGSASRDSKALLRAIAQARDSEDGETSVSAPFATLVVCPQSVLHTWASEACKWLGWDSTPSDAPTVSLIRSSADALRGPSRGRGVARAGPCWHRSVLVIASYETLASDAARARSLSNHVWRRVVLDEAHRLRNDPTSCACLYDLRAARRWACTGTLFHNGFSDVGHVARFIGKMPYAQRSWWVQHQNNDDAIAAWRREHLKMRGKELLRLPPVRFETVDTPLSEVERSAYDALLRRALSLYAHFRQTCTNRDDVLSIVLNTLRQMRQFCNHPLLAIGKAEFERNLDIWEKSVLQQGTEAVTHEEGKSAQRDCARHAVAAPLASPAPVAAEIGQVRDCDVPRIETGDTCESSGPQKQDRHPGLLDGIGTKCASAQSTASMREHAHHVRTLYAEWREIFGAEACEKRGVPVMDALLRTKLRAVMRRAIDVLHKDPGAKIVLFSQWTGTLRALRVAFRAHDVASAEYHGKMTVDQREQQLRLFSESESVPRGGGCTGKSDGEEGGAGSQPREVRVILVSLRAGGIGINLSCASHVFMVDGWYNPFLESQAIDRVNRLGQSHAEVLCVRFHVPMTVEDDVADIQSRKRRAASRFYGRGEGALSALAQPLGPRYASLRETIGAGAEAQIEESEDGNRSINMHQAFGAIARAVVSEKEATALPSKGDGAAPAVDARSASVSVQISSSDAAMERGRRNAELRRLACAREGTKLRQTTFGQAGLGSSISLPQWAIVAAGGTCVSARGPVSELPTLEEQRACAVRDGGRVHVDAEPKMACESTTVAKEQQTEEERQEHGKRRRLRHRLVCASTGSPIRTSSLPAKARVSDAQMKAHKRAARAKVGTQRRRV